MRVLALLSGEIDITERLEPEHHETLSNEAKVEVSQTIATENKDLHFCTNKAPFDKPALRLAACHAIDREQVLEVMGGLINGNEDPKVDAALDAQQAEPNPIKRAEKIGIATGVIASKAPSVSLFTAVLLHGKRRGLEDVYFDPNGPIDATRAELKA